MRYVRRQGSSVSWHIVTFPGGNALCGEERPRRGWYDVVPEAPSATLLCWECRDEAGTHAADARQEAMAEQHAADDRPAVEPNEMPF